MQAHLYTARLFLHCWMASQFLFVSLCYRGERVIAETTTSSRKPTESTHKQCCARSSCWRRRRGRWVTCCRFKCQDCSRRTRAWHNSKRRLSLVCGPWRLHHSESMSVYAFMRAFASRHLKLPLFSCERDIHTALATRSVTRRGLRQSMSKQG